MPRERTYRENRREQNCRGQHHEHRVGQPVQIAQHDASDAQMPTQVGVEIVGQIDDVDKDRKAERGRDEDLPEFDEHIAVERPHYSRQAASLSRRTRRSFQWVLERTQPVTAPIISFASPPRAVVPSWPIFASIHSAIKAKMTFAIHIDTTAGMRPRLAIDSPAMRHT